VFAYFALEAGAVITVRVDSTPMQRVDVLQLAAANRRLRFATIDGSGAWLFMATAGPTARLLSVPLTSFSYSQSLQVADGAAEASCVLLDAAQVSAHLGLATAPAKVVQITARNKRITGELLLPPELDYIRCAALNATRDMGYFGS
jgi:hypothetical protein